ncbi:hypothetical protein FHW79_006225 [Azospirillum sp. OGB3]|uniref:hypothetical protein n=1 Tax=Azospirillum sp. OGB3 TaxID=2587012 RepID=UPI001605C3D9|nr:hypothetical protein [Azospirillum sp. OGB3]MBB3268550.1 hypothetical protein [Azospirillum sp. OGB3]
MPVDVLPRYEEEARNRVATLPPSTIENFLDHLPVKKRASAYAPIPLRGGFRDNKQVTTKVRQKLFVTHIRGAARTKPEAPEWRVLGKLWRSYGEQLLGGTFGSALDVAAGAREEDTPGFAFCRFLMTEAGDRLCREDAETLILFSPFAGTDEMNVLVRSLGTREELEVKNLYKKIPAELDQLRADLEKTRADQAEAEKRLSELETTTAELRRRSASADEVAQLSSRLVDGERETQAAIGRMDAIAGQVADLLSRLKASEKASTNEFRELGERLDRSEATAGDVGVRLAELEETARRLRDELTGGQAIARLNRLEALVGVLMGDPPAPVPATSADKIPMLDPKGLGALLFNASAISATSLNPLLVLDAALRGRELPLLLGSLARELAESWIQVVGSRRTSLVTLDPTLLAFEELFPRGSRGQRAPLAPAVARALAEPDRISIALFDDLDPPSAGFWLPELARALRRPSAYGLPSNLLAIAVMDSPPGQLPLASQRLGELFPMALPGCKRATPRKPVVGELPLPMVIEPLSVGRAARVNAVRRAGSLTMSQQDADIVASALQGYLDTIDGAPAPSTNNQPLAYLGAALRLLQENSTGR